ncbi:hypothetical protein NL526_29370, partial [Klebsiella pneumoniae]|nr:hypothetical protein [Klebsiella pneumoniae]
MIAWIRHQQQQGIGIFLFGHYSRAVTAGWICHWFFGVRYAVYLHGNDLFHELDSPFWRHVV